MCISARPFGGCIGLGSEHRPGHHHSISARTTDPAFFDEKAATWDDDPAKVERAEVVAGCIASSVPLGSNTRLLEYGAGTGLVTQALRDSVGPVTLVDASEGMRAVMEAKIEAGTLADARVWSMDLTEEEPPEDRFDVIVSVMVLHHIADLGRVLMGFTTLLAPGGYLCIVDLDHEDGSFHPDGFGGHHGFHRHELADQLTSVGLTVVSFQDCHQVVRDGVSYPLFLAVCRRLDAGMVDAS